MSEIAKRPRRWPWIVGIGLGLLSGCAGGVVFSAIGMAHMYNVPCPALYQPRAGDGIVPLASGPGVFQPRLLSHPMTFPAAGRLARVQGVVTLIVYVGTDGTVFQARLLRSSGFCPFDIAALKDVTQWRFSPAMQAGAPVAAWRLMNIFYDRGRVTAKFPTPLGTET